MVEGCLGPWSVQVIVPWMLWYGLRLLRNAYKILDHVTFHIRLSNQAIYNSPLARWMEELTSNLINSKKFIKNIIFKNIKILSKLEIEKMISCDSSSPSIYALGQSTRLPLQCRFCNQRYKYQGKFIFISFSVTIW